MRYIWLTATYFYVITISFLTKIIKRDICQIFERIEFFIELVIKLTFGLVNIFIIGTSTIRHMYLMSLFITIFLGIFLPFTGRFVIMSTAARKFLNSTSSNNFLSFLKCLINRIPIEKVKVKMS